MKKVGPPESSPLNPTAASCAGPDYRGSVTHTLVVKKPLIMRAAKGSEGMSLVDGLSIAPFNHPCTSAEYLFYPLQILN